jgi:nitroimidazol reductase NimA-like FMN-containing flavoprotein (pyridoxamine 5'-phosphate oxidase superfamily)
MNLTKPETDFIRSQGVARIATVSPDGMPHNVAVCPVWDGGKIYVGTEKEATKAKNLRTNPHAAIVFDLYRDSWRELRGIMLQCSARFVNEAEFKKIRRKLYAKYPKYKTDAALEPDDSVIVEFTPQKKFTWGME